MTTDERLDAIDQTLRDLKQFLLEFRMEIVQRFDLVEQQANLKLADSRRS